MSFFAELRRRNVIRVAGLYVVSAWLLVQVADTLLPVFEAPGWVMKVLVGLLAAGALPALVFSWVFELTPEGLKRESQVDRSQSIVDHTARKLDVAVIVLLLAVGALLLWRPAARPESVPAAAGSSAGAPPAAASGPAAAAAVDDKSIAVLPFADFSPGGDQAWFADGLAEEILNALARTPDLQVSARTSSFRYKGSTLAIPQIAAELGVAHVLEGSVRSTPQRIRVTAQLIRAADGFHLWSQNYDRDPADMIEIQEDLARQIATAMQTSMDPTALAEMADVGTRSVEAYQAHIRGVAAEALLDPSEYLRAYEQFEQARQIDPGFAAAHARAADFWLAQLDPTSTLGGLTPHTAAEIGQRFDERIELAIRHAASAGDRRRYEAQKALRELRWRDAIGHYEAVLAERPGDAAAISALLDIASKTTDEAMLRQHLDDIWEQAQTRLELASAHVNSAHRANDRARAADQALVLVQRWPEHVGILYQAHRALLWDRRVEAAAEVLVRWQALSGNTEIWGQIPPARQACAEGRRAEVEQALERLPEQDLSQRWHLLMLLGRKAEADAVLMPLERAGNLFALGGFLNYRHFDPTPFPSLARVLERERVQRPPVLELPFACPPAEAAAP